MHVFVRLRALGLLVLALLAVFLALPSVAMAAGIGADSSTKAVLVVSPAWQVALSTLIPIVVGAITKATLPTVWKGLLTLALNAIATLVLTAEMTSAALITQQALLQAILAFAASVAIYLGILKPAGLHSNDSTGLLGPTVGIGPAGPVP